MREESFVAINDSLTYIFSSARMTLIQSAFGDLLCKSKSLARLTLRLTRAVCCRRRVVGKMLFEADGSGGGGFAK